MAIRNNHFSSIDTKKSTFNLSHKRYTSINFGSVRPNYVKMCLPDEHLYVRPKISYELKPTTDKIVGSISLNNRSYYVPFRSIWGGFENFIADNKDIHYKDIQNIGQLTHDSVEADRLPYFTRNDLFCNALRCLSGDNSARMFELNYKCDDNPRYVADDDIFTEVVGINTTSTTSTSLTPLVLQGNRCAESVSDLLDRYGGGSAGIYSSSTYGSENSALIGLTIANPLLERFSKYGVYNKNGQPVSQGIFQGGSSNALSVCACSSWVRSTISKTKVPLEPFFTYNATSGATIASTLDSVKCGSIPDYDSTNSLDDSSPFDYSIAWDQTGRSPISKVVTYWTNRASALDYYNHFCKPITETTDADYLAITFVTLNYQFAFIYVTGINTATYPCVKDNIPYGCPSWLVGDVVYDSRTLVTRPSSLCTSSAISRCAGVIFFSNAIELKNETANVTNSTITSTEILSFTHPNVKGGFLVTSDDCYFMHKDINGWDYNNDWTPLLINVALLGLLDDADLFGRGSLVENMGVPLFKDIYGSDYYSYCKTHFLDKVNYTNSSSSTTYNIQAYYPLTEHFARVDFPKTKYIRVPCFDVFPKCIEENNTFRTLYTGTDLFPLLETRFSALPFIAYGRVFKRHYLPSWDLFRDQTTRIDSPYFHSMSLVTSLNYNEGGDIFENSYLYGPYRDDTMGVSFLMNGTFTTPSNVKEKTSLYWRIEHLPNSNCLLLNFLNHAPLTYDYFGKGWKHENGNLGDKSLLEVQSVLSGANIASSSIGTTIAQLTNKTKKLLSKAFSFASFGGDDWTFEDFLNHHFDTHLSEVGLNDVYLGGYSFPLQFEDILNTGEEDQLGQKVTIGAGVQKPSGVDFYSPEFGVFLSLGTLSTPDLVDTPQNPTLMDYCVHNLEFMPKFHPLYQNLGDEEFKNKLDIFQDRGGDAEGVVLGYNLRNIDHKQEVDKFMGEFSGTYRSQLIFRRLPIAHERGITMSYLQPASDEYIIPFADSANDNILLVYDFNIKSNSYLSNDNIMGFE